MRRLYLGLIVLILHPILFDNNCNGSNAIVAATSTTKDNIFFSTSQYFQFEKGKLIKIKLNAENFNNQIYSHFAENDDIFNDDERAILKRTKGDRRGWVKI